MNFLGIISKINLLELLILIFIFFILFFLINLLTRKLKIILREKVSLQSLNILSKFLVYGFILIYLIFILSFMGVNLSGLIVAGGFLSIIIGLATQKVLGNVVSGLFLMIERPIRIGQPVDINQTTGIIEEIRFLSTVIRSFEGPFVRIPNETVFNSLIINFGENIARRIDYLIDIRYSDDVELAIKVTKELLDNECYVLAFPEPEVFVENFASSSAQLRVRFWAPTEKWYATKCRLLQKIRENLEHNGICIPFPQMEVKIHNIEPSKF